MGIHHGIRVLANDFDRTPARANREVEETVERSAKRGNMLARGFAKISAGDHGKWYHRAFEAERLGLTSWVYGPLAHRRQGNMSFERGSRNQPPHGDLARSADIIGVELPRDIGDAVERAMPSSRSVT